MNTDPNQMLRRLVGLRLLLNRPVTAEDPPVSFDSGDATPDASHNPWSAEDQLKQLVARQLLNRGPLADMPLPQAAQSPNGSALPNLNQPPPADAAPAGAAPNAPSPASGFKWRRSAIYDYPDNSEDVADGGTVAWRTNNPGNVKYGDFTRDRGAIGHYGDFAIFPNEATGAAALDALLNSSDYQTGTINDAIAKFAPPKENNTPAYQAFVSGRLRVPGTTPMSNLNAGQMRALADAIRAYEGWRVGNRVHLQARQ